MKRKEAGFIKAQDDIEFVEEDMSDLLNICMTLENDSKSKISTRTCQNKSKEEC